MRRNIYLCEQNAPTQVEEYSKSSTSLKSTAQGKYHKFSPGSLREQKITLPFIDFIFEPNSDNHFKLDSIEQAKSVNRQKKFFKTLVPDILEITKPKTNKHRKQEVHFVKEQSQSSAKGSKQRKLSFMYKGSSKPKEIQTPRSLKVQQKFLGDHIKQTITRPKNNYLPSFQKCSDPIKITKCQPKYKNEEALKLKNISMQLQRQLNHFKEQINEWIKSLKIQTLNTEKQLNKSYNREQYEKIDQIFENFNGIVNKVTIETSNILEKLENQQNSTDSLFKSAQKYQTQQNIGLRILEPIIKLTSSPNVLTLKTRKSNIENQPDNLSFGYQSFQKIDSPDLKINMNKQKDIVHYEENEISIFGQQKQTESILEFNQQASIKDIHEAELSGKNNQSFKILTIPDEHNVCSAFDLNMTQKQVKPNVRWALNNSRNHDRSRSSIISMGSVDDKMKGFNEALSRIKKIMDTPN